MARNQESVSIPHKTWVELTNADVTEITFQVITGRVEIRRSDTNAPDDDADGWAYAQREGERKILMDDISLSGGARLWAKGAGYPASIVVVDHA